MDVEKKFKEYVARISTTDRIAVYTGPDVDGLSSAAITSEAIRRIRGKPIDLFIYEESNRPGLTQSNSLKISDCQINKLVVLDISIDNAPDETIEVMRGLDTLVLDHHLTVRDLNKEGILFVKPEYFSKVEPVRYPSSKMTYDLFGKVVSLGDLDWISALGIMSDGAYDVWSEHVDKVAEKQGIKYRKGEVWKSDLGKAVTVLNRALLYDSKNAPECLEALASSKSPRDLIDSGIRRYKHEIDEEIKRLEDDFRMKRRLSEDGKTMYYEFNSPFGVCSTLSTILGYNYMKPSDNLVVVQVKKDKCVVNLRRNDKKVNLASIARIAVDGLPDSSGGGHIPAAGAEIRMEDLPEFKKRILELLSKAE